MVGKRSIFRFVRLCPCAHVPMTLLVAMMLFLPSCWITDHSERDITPDDIRFPASGYEKADTKDHPVMRFDRTHIDMGTIVQGTQFTDRYTFTNTGRSALVITDVRGSCGCTVSKDWPRQPIKPGEKASIEVSFDSEGRTGRQDKTVTVVANTSPPSTVLTLGGEVVGPSGVEPVE